MKRPDVMWHVPLDMKNDSDGFWVYIPRWIVRAYRLVDRTGHARHNLNARVAIRIADKGEAPIKYYRRYHKNQTFKYFKENWQRKMQLEDRKKLKEASP